MDPRTGVIKSGLIVGNDAVLFPIAETRGFGAFLAAQFRREGLLRDLFRSAGIGLGFGPFAGFADAGGDLFGG